MRMNLQMTLRLNLRWAILMAVAFGFLAVGRLVSGTLDQTTAIASLISIAYVANAFFALKGRRLPVVLSVVVALLILRRWLPMVIINLYMFFSGHDLYYDSPATIIIVVIYAIIFVFPSLVLICLYISQRKQVMHVLKNGHFFNNLGVRTLPRRRCVIGAVVILGISFAFLVWLLVCGELKMARRGTAENTIGSLELSLDIFELDNGRYPTTEEGLEALLTKPQTIPELENWRGPYTKSPGFNDPWGNPYIYIPAGSKHRYCELKSYGPDGKDGGGDDIVLRWKK